MNKKLELCASCGEVVKAGSLCATCETRIQFQQQETYETKNQTTKNQGFAYNTSTELDLAISAFLDSLCKVHKAHSYSFHAFREAMRRAGGDKAHGADDQADAGADSRSFAGSFALPRQACVCGRAGGLEGGESYTYPASQHD